MGLQSIAVCVVDEALLARLAEMGIDYVQGYAIGRPQPFRDQGRGLIPERRTGHLRLLEAGADKVGSCVE
jgi:EAL domain-containing protein (putative c-di-GMP-specific phosphodiesterase class I)